ncbi:hypothetical protein [Rhodococcus pyridinivorans]|uniref:Uncharacterized protein n=1 Tax=Rhodococcus pyridinivorans TaxID=103816 RepID=A0A7M2XHL3_9NOCA|nr:hypothetical protein [Rhodococcus pyridinivorans]QOV97195.1 hypothetical protein INP59_14560 [Rhodococcus pyridinivorans]
MSEPSQYIAESAIFGDTNLVDWTIAPAMRTVAAHSKSTDEVRDMLEMLGLIEPRPVSASPTTVVCQASCLKCGKPGRKPNQSLEKWPGTVILKGRGMCAPCYTAVLDAEKEARDAVA